MLTVNAPTSDPNCPSPHAVQVLSAGCSPLNIPIGHRTQCEAPIVVPTPSVSDAESVVKWPELQTEHVVDPESAVNMPAAHGEQLSSPSSLNWPAGH